MPILDGEPVSHDQYLAHLETIYSAAVMAGDMDLQAHTAFQIVEAVEAAGDDLLSHNATLQ